MTDSRGLYVPPEPAWLQQAMAEETLYLKALREPEPPMTAAPNGISQLATALVKARSEIHAIAKDSTNPHFKSRYASLDVIIETVVPLLNAHGLTLLQGCVAPDRDDTGKVTAFTVRTTLLHTSGESLDRDVVMPVAKSDPQGAGAALTYGRRYGISALLGLATDEDDDGNSASRGAKQERKAPAARPNASTPKPAVAVNGAGKKPEDMRMPFGDHKDERLGDISTPVLVKALAWCREKDAVKFATLIATMETVLDERTDDLAEVS